MANQNADYAWIESLYGEPDHGPYADEIEASEAMDELGLDDDAWKIVIRPEQNADYERIAEHFHGVMAEVLRELEATETDQERRELLPQVCEKLQDAVWYGECHLPGILAHRGARNDRSETTK